MYSKKSDTYILYSGYIHIHIVYLCGRVICSCCQLFFSCGKLNWNSADDLHAGRANESEGQARQARRSLRGPRLGAIDMFRSRGALARSLSVASEASTG